MDDDDDDDEEPADDANKGKPIKKKEGDDEYEVEMILRSRIATGVLVDQLPAAGSSGSAEAPALSAEDVNAALGGGDEPKKTFEFVEYLTKWLGWDGDECHRVSAVDWTPRPKLDPFFYFSKK